MLFDERATKFCPLLSQVSTLKLMSPAPRTGARSDALGIFVVNNSFAQDAGTVDVYRPIIHRHEHQSGVRKSGLPGYNMASGGSSDTAGPEVRLNRKQNGMAQMQVINMK